MTITFSTEFGKIEIDFQANTAYFFKDDYETDLNKDHSFQDVYKRLFRVEKHEFTRWENNQLIREKPLYHLTIIRPQCIGVVNESGKTLFPIGD